MIFLRSRKEGKRQRRWCEEGRRGQRYMAPNMGKSSVFRSWKRQLCQYLDFSPLWPISSFWPSELWDNKFVLCQAIALWYFFFLSFTAAIENIQNSDTHTKICKTGIIIAFILIWLFSHPVKDKIQILY